MLCSPFWFPRVLSTWPQRLSALSSRLMTSCRRSENNEMARRSSSVHLHPPPPSFLPCLISDVVVLLLPPTNLITRNNNLVFWIISNYVVPREHIVELLRSSVSVHLLLVSRMCAHVRCFGTANGDAALCRGEILGERFQTGSLAGAQRRKQAREVKGHARGRQREQREREHQGMSSAHCPSLWLLCGSLCSCVRMRMNLVPKIGTKG